MSKARHPYQDYEKHPAWRTVERAVKALIKNGDIEARTDLKYIVGFLCKQLDAAALLNSETLPPTKPREDHALVR
jgi:hypothetical protein